MSIAVESHAEERQPALPLPVRPPAAPAATALLADARRGLAEARHAAQPAPRFIAAYLAALRAGAAVLAASGRPHRGRARPASVWVLLEAAAPELTDWTAYFAAHSAARAAAQAGNTRRITPERADELLRQSVLFVELARDLVHGRTPVTAPSRVRQCDAPPTLRKASRRR
ncbi:SAV_6107 family HEPN domain-containing protein [Amycolatopsis thermoflava]|uniref:SAV_6107 family HEPN domain-containing protein n=1 Tax=Amycolatopsis thermoflava TaxID=84480 RepID=UPI003661D290